jgi:thiol-disulfide isomerase/thioredoxin
VPVADEPEKVSRLALGVDPKLYGKTLDNKEFDWESLRGKYVLVKFTATWCRPCDDMIPLMLENYEKYKDKGLEIVSVYMWQERGGDPDPVETVKKNAEEKKLPWIILSEPLSKKAKQPEYENFYNIEGVPTLVLVDKEGKIIYVTVGGILWDRKLAEVFE